MIDCISTYHDSFVSNAVTVNGVVRLFNVWVTTGSTTGDVNKIVIRNKDSLGDIGLEYDFVFTSWANPNNNLMIPGGGILFPDGMHFDTGNGAGASTDIDSVTFVYQNG